MIKELVIRLGLEGATELNSAISLASKGFDTLTNSAKALLNQLGDGEKFNNLYAQFQKIEQSAGRTADQGLAKLRSAVGGLISDAELLQRANLAESLGINRDTFLELASGAEALAESVGQEALPALDSLINAFGKGQDKQLLWLGINADVRKAQEDLAAKAGRATSELTEQGQIFAAQQAILEAYRSKLAAVGQTSSSASDSLDRVKTTVSNLITQVIAGVERNKDLAATFEEVNSKLQQIDVTALVNGLAAIAKLAAEGTIALGEFAEKAAIAMNPEGFIKDSLDASSKRLMAQLNTVEEIEAKRIQIHELISGASKRFDELAAADAGAEALANQLELIRSYERQLPMLGERLDELAKSADKTNEPLKTTTESVGLFATSAAEAAKQAEEVADAVRGLNQEVESSKFQNLFSEVASGNLVINFEELTNKYKQSLIDAQTAALGTMTPEVRAAIESKAEYEAGEIITQRDEAAREIARNEEEKLKEAYANSVAVWEDLFMNAIDGTTFNLEDALKRVAVGFAAQMAASIFQIPAGISSASDLGGWLAGSLLKGGAGGLGEMLGLDSLFGAGLSGIGPIADGAGYAGLLGGSGSGMLASAGPYAAAAAAAYFLGDQLGVWEGNFGGTTNPETMDRRNFRGQLQQILGEDLNFSGYGGNISLFDSDYSLGNRNNLTDAAIGFANPLAALFSGGDPKKQTDFAGIFADALDNAENFNQVLINTAGLMDGLGYSAEEVKDGLKEAFLDGELSLEEFSAGVANMNLIAQDNLVGTGSVKDAIDIVTDALSSPRTKLKGLEFAFKEMAEIGIDTSEEVRGYLVDSFGPDVAEAFSQLAAAGIDSWEDIANASADQVALIFRVIDPLFSAIEDGFSATANNASKAFVKGTQPIVDRLSQIQQGAIRMRPEALSGAGNVNPSTGRPSSTQPGFVNLNKSLYKYAS